MSELDAYKDLQLTQRGFNVQSSDRAYVDLEKTFTGMDTGSSGIATVQGRANLAQAIVNRLLTRQGELAELGHPEYGSRLHELLGEANNLRLRVLTEIYIRDCLAQETRIAEVQYVTLSPPVRGIDRSVLKVSLGILPIGETQGFSFTIPINI
jgi:phage baseplate assembly protein W